MYALNCTPFCGLLSKYAKVIADIFYNDPEYEKKFVL